MDGIVMFGNIAVPLKWVFIVFAFGFLAIGIPVVRKFQKTGDNAYRIFAGIFLLAGILCIRASATFL